MKDDFKNKDINYEKENKIEEDLPGELTKTKVLILRISSLIFIFSGLFFLSFYVSLKIIHKNNSINIDKKFTESKGDMVDEKKKIILKQGAQEEVYTIAEFKKSASINYDLTTEALNKKLESEGYLPLQESKESYVYVRQNEFEVGKYYLGLSNGFIALYKADESTQLKLIKEFKNETPEHLLPESVKSELKKHVYSFYEEDDAEMYISQFR